MKIKKLLYPYNRDEFLALRVGEAVYLTGKMFTARDAVHKYLYDGGKIPFSLSNQILYHCGPVIIKDKVSGRYLVNAAGPTTSAREEPYQAAIMRDHGILGVIGKGGMGIKTLDGCKQYGCVYLHAIGGAAQVLAAKIESVDNVFLSEFGSPEAMWEFTAKDFPVIVTMDSQGNSLHESVKSESLRRFKELIGVLG